MATKVNMAKVKETAKREEERAAARKAGGFRYWTPKVGKNKIRLLPPWTAEGPNAGAFYREVFTHWGIGPNSSRFTCPQKTPGLSDAHARPCPVCQYVDQLRATGEPDDSEMANDYSARSQYMSNIVDIDDPVFVKEDVEEWKKFQKDPSKKCPFAIGDTKVQIYGYGQTVWQGMLTIFSDLDLDFTDVTTGRDLIIRRTGKTKNDTKYQVLLDAVDKSLDVVGKPIEEAMSNLDVVNLPKGDDDMNAALQGRTAPPQGTLPPPGPQESLPPPTPAESEAEAESDPEPEAATEESDPEPEAATEETEEEEPPCFGDKDVWDKDDIECVGGTKPNDEAGKPDLVYDPCPYFQKCGEKCGKLKPPKKSRRKAAKKSRRKAAAPASDADVLEKEMADALK